MGTEVGSDPKLAVTDPPGRGKASVRSTLFLTNVSRELLFDRGQVGEGNRSFVGPAAGEGGEGKAAAWNIVCSRMSQAIWSLGSCQRESDVGTDCVPH